MTKLSVVDFYAYRGCKKDTFAAEIFLKPTMKLNSEISGDVLVLNMLPTKVVAANAQEFDLALRMHFVGNKHVVVDMSTVEFVDSTGLGVLISCLRTRQDRRCDFRLCAMSGDVRKRFESMRLHRIFNVYDTKSEAVFPFTGT